MKLSFLWFGNVRKISVASYMWLPLLILLRVNMSHGFTPNGETYGTRELECESCERSGVKEDATHLLMLNANSGALRRKAIHCPEIRKRRARKACAIFSGRTN